MRNILSLRIFSRAVLSAAAGLLLLGSSPGATLEGRWRLVEQRYGSGSANLASLEAPVRLEFALSGPQLRGRIWASEDRARSLPWPALLTEHGPQSLEIREILLHPGSNLARAVYLFRPAGEDGETVEVVEEYRLSKDRNALIGSVTITSAGKKGSQGAYILHRRFEREP